MPANQNFCDPNLQGMMHKTTSIHSLHHVIIIIIFFWAQGDTGKSKNHTVCNRHDQINLHWSEPRSSPVTTQHEEKVKLSESYVITN